MTLWKCAGRDSKKWKFIEHQGPSQLLSSLGI